jgi:hypothetical protein
VGRPCGGELFTRLPDEQGTGTVDVAGGDRAGDRLAVLVARVLPPMVRRCKLNRSNSC